MGYLKERLVKLSYPRHGKENTPDVSDGHHGLVGSQSGSLRYRGGDNLRVTMIFGNGCNGPHRRSRGFVRIDFLDNKRHLIALVNHPRHTYWELRILWPEASVVEVLRRPIQAPDPPCLRCIQRAELDKPFMT